MYFTDVLSLHGLKRSEIVICGPKLKSAKEKTLSDHHSEQPVMHLYMLILKLSNK